MNEEIKKKLLDILENHNSATNEENQDEFKGYLVSDSDFDLDEGKDNDNSKPKFIIWPKETALDENEETRNTKFNQIEKDIIAFTSSKSTGADPSIYVIQDDLEAFATWLHNKYPTFVVSMKIEEVLGKYKSQVQTENITPESIPEPSAEITLEPQVEAPKENTEPTEEPETPSLAEDSLKEETANLNEVVPESINSSLEVTPLTGEKVENKGLEDKQETPSILPDSQPKEDNNFEFKGTPVNHSEEANSELNNVATLEKKPSVGGRLARAGFVKFPIFLLSIVAIAALGIFIGKMFYIYFGQ